MLWPGHKVLAYAVCQLGLFSKLGEDAVTRTKSYMFIRALKIHEQSSMMTKMNGFDQSERARVEDPELRSLRVANE